MAFYFGKIPFQPILTAVDVKENVCLMICKEDKFLRTLFDFIDDKNMIKVACDLELKLCMYSKRK